MQVLKKLWNLLNTNVLDSYSNDVLCFVCRKDVRLPQQLQRAMAAEAEASREARAKVLVFSIIEYKRNGIIMLPW